MDIIKTIEADAVLAWDKFLAGVHYLATETEALAAKVEQVDPGIQQQLQALVQAGEAGALVLANAGTGGMTNIVAAGAEAAETLVANYVQKATGNAPAGQAISAASVGVLQQASAALQAAIPVAIAKLASSLTAQIPGAPTVVATGGTVTVQPVLPAPPASVQ